MATDKALEKRLDGMRSSRREAMVTAARREHALRLLEENGEVTTAQIDAAMEDYSEPTDEMLHNMMAAKTAAGAAYEDREVGAAKDAAERSGDRVRKLSGLLDAAQEAAAKAKAEVDAALDRSRLAQELAALAATLGTGQMVQVGAPASAQASPAMATGAKGAK